MVVAENVSIILTAPRPWFGNQQLGGFVVSLDGKKAGTLMPQGSLELRCESGCHRLRARRGWYFSPPMELDLAPGEQIRLSVDIAGRGLSKWLTTTFRPRHSLAITPDA